MHRVSNQSGLPPLLGLGVGFSIPTMVLAQNVAGMDSSPAHCDNLRNPGGCNGLVIDEQ